MIRELTITNFKSIDSLRLELGRVNVFIGANGSGKSNILEALAFASASANRTLGNEFLASRGIRVTDDPRLMRAAFDPDAEKAIGIRFADGRSERALDYQLRAIGRPPYSRWEDTGRRFPGTEEQFQAILDQKSVPMPEKSQQDLARGLQVALDSWDDGRAKALGIVDFLIYSPEASALRVFQGETQIQPLGVRGEGLLKLLQVMAMQYPADLEILKECLRCIEWFDDLKVIPVPLASGGGMRVKDRYLGESIEFIDQKSTNEGFLFLLFYFAVLLGPETPRFFAVDNVDASLNPKLCEHLMLEIARLAVKRDKQVILTTHNAALLDGLNLRDDEQRLFVVYRNIEGKTRVKRKNKPPTADGDEPVRLSELFMQGMLGGLPLGF